MSRVEAGDGKYYWERIGGGKVVLAVSELNDEIRKGKYVVVSTKEELDKYFDRLNKNV